MANTATKVAASHFHLVYLLEGDGTVTGPTITNATLLADVTAGTPIYDMLNAVYTTQGNMRDSLLAGKKLSNIDGATGGLMYVQLREAVNDVTAEHNQITVDVDTDAVATTKAEINICMSDTTGQKAYLVITCLHSIVR